LKGYGGRVLHVDLTTGATRIEALERLTAELSHAQPQPNADVRPLRTVRGPNPAGG